MICEPTFVSPKCSFGSARDRLMTSSPRRPLPRERHFGWQPKWSRRGDCSPIISFDQSFFFAVGGASSGLEGFELSLYTNGTWSGVMIRAMSRTMTLATPSTGSLAW
jgi:hypothetical protein